MFVAMHTESGPCNTITFRLHALKMGNYYIASRRYGFYDLHVPREWDVHPACVGIMAFLAEKQDEALDIPLGDARIRLDPVLASDLFDCLFEYALRKNDE